jgi:hypothetical protein
VENEVKKEHEDMGRGRGDSWKQLRTPTNAITAITLLILAITGWSSLPAKPRAMSENPKAILCAEGVGN